MEGMEMDHDKEDLSQFPGVVKNLPCCFYIVEAKAPHRFLYVNEEMLRLFDCLDVDEFCRHTGGFAANVIAHDDRARVEQDIEHELAEKHDRFDHVQGHLFTRTSRIRYADISGRLVETETHGKVHYCTMQEIDIPLPGVVVDRDIRDYVIRHLDEAIDNHWIQIYYQPVIRTLTGELCGMEALARWVDPHIGFLSPASFIPVLEQVRLIHRLDAYVFEEVCRTQRQRLNHNMAVTPISFNLSRYDFDMLDVFSFVETTRKKYAVPRDFLHVEITESALAQDSSAVHQTLDRLRNEGYEVWLDDFGSGYSSLNILRDYTVDLIKLDMGFLRNFTEKSRSIISSVISMAKDLGVKTLAEGVETKEHADFLASIGCGRQQGYFYGKPRPLAGTLAHIEADGRHIELRKWCHYYDVASMVIRQTNRTCAILDIEDNWKGHFLYTNKAYREQIHMLGYRMQDLEERLSKPAQTDVSRLFQEYVSRAQQSHQPESFWYIDGGKYISICIRIIYEANHHKLVKLELQNISKSDPIRQQGEFDEHLRYLYSLFESIALVDFQKDTIEPLYFKGKDYRPEEQKTAHDIRKSLQDFAKTCVYEEDRQRYLAFSNPDTIIERIRKNPHGRITCQYRLRDHHGNYTWRECVAILLSNGLTPLILTANKTVDVPVSLPVNDTAADQSFQAILWKSLQKNTQFCYFWKDKERRFLGATKAFLKYYGFQSVKEILGKTDEDMKWHIDNTPYQLDELDVLHKGKHVQNVVGECIIKGTLHHITCYKWPIYREGEIIGLMGVFFDADALYREIHRNMPTPYDDPITGLHNRQGFLGDLTRYQETYTMEKKSYALILLESCFDEHIQESYDSALLRSLIRQEADILRQAVGTESAISRIQHATFAVLRIENDHKESEAIAQKLQQRLQSIHQIDGNPVTITFQYSIVHADDSAIHHSYDGNVGTIYRIARERLRHRAK